MMKKYILFLLLLAFSLNGFALVKGDYFIVNNVRYKVTDAANSKVTTCNSYAGAAKNGVLTIPATVKYDDVTWYVKIVTFNSGTLNSEVNKVVLSEGIEELAY